MSNEISKDQEISCLEAELARLHGVQDELAYLRQRGGVPSNAVPPRLEPGVGLALFDLMDSAGFLAPAISETVTPKTKMRTSSMPRCSRHLATCG